MTVAVELLGVALPGWVMLVLAALGGAFGAAVGALRALCLAGFLVIAGETVRIIRVGAVGAAAVEPNSMTAGLTGALGFGPPFGPHVAFAGGVAAAAYAARKGYMDEGFGYHLAKDVCQGLGTRPDVLAVGGAFGVLGWLGVRALEFLSFPADPVATTIVLSAFLARIAFGYPLVGRVAGSGVLDMSPFERRQTREPPGSEPPPASPDGGTAGRLATEPWLPFQYEWHRVGAVGVGAGAPGAVVAVGTGSPFVAFGVSLAALTFLVRGTEVPVTHHVTLPASTAALATLAWGPPAAVLVGTLFGLVGALSGEVLQRVFYAHGDTHVDPPAFAIAVTVLAVAVLATLGVFPSGSWVATP